MITTSSCIEPDLIWAGEEPSEHKYEQVEEEMEEEDNIEESHDGQEAPAQEDKADGKE